MTTKTLPKKQSKWLEDIKQTIAANKFHQFFATDKIGTEKEYAEIEETISPEVLKIISDFLKN